MSGGGKIPHTARAPWVMLLALLSAFALSQAFRTVTAIMAQGLQADFGLPDASLGAFAALFGLSFALAQFVMGAALDTYGLRRTVLCAFACAIAGALLSALSPSYAWLMAGQLLIGVGCAPAFLACALFIARHFPAERFAFYSGMSLGAGGLGLMFTGTPLAWLVQLWGWRAGFAALALLAVLAWLLIFALVHEPPLAIPGAPPEPLHRALIGFAALFRLPQTWGIVLLGLSCYAAFLSLRGLWLGPLLMGRFGFSLVDSGNVALALSLISLFTPALFGRIDPGPLGRRRLVANASMAIALCFALLAWLSHAGAAVVLILLMGLGSGFSSLQYADVRSSYPPALTARALSLYTMALFLGASLMQWFTGVVAGWAGAWALDPHRAVLLTIALWLGLASLAFRKLPASALLKG